jgi:hypothetical protein
VCVKMKKKDSLLKEMKKKAREEERGKKAKTSKLHLVQRVVAFSLASRRGGGRRTGRVGGRCNGWRGMDLPQPVDGDAAIKRVGGLGKGSPQVLGRAKLVVVHSLQRKKRKEKKGRERIGQSDKGKESKERGKQSHHNGLRGEVRRGEQCRPKALASLQPVDFSQKQIE